MAAEGRFFDGLLQTSAKAGEIFAEEERTGGDFKRAGKRLEEWKMGKAVELREVEIAALKPYERNAKQHSREQVDKIGRSIRELGFLSPCLIDQDFNVIAGHGRIMAAKEIGRETVPCVFIEGLTEEQRKAYILADNRLTELGEWDMDKVQQELADLADADFDISITGFDTDLRFDDSMAQITDDGWSEEDQPAEEPRSRIGDIYQLGDHRLMCGDSTDPEMVTALMDGEQADLMVTDPPYNIGLGGDGSGSAQSTDETSNRRKRQEDGAFLLNDNLGEKEFIDFLTKAMVNAKNALREGGAFYVWYATRTTEQFLAGMRNAELEVKQILIWVKSHFTLGRQDYQWQHEPCLYGWKDGAAHYFLDSRKQSTVVEDVQPDLSSMKKADMEALLREIYNAEKMPTDVIREAKPNVSELHPTMKPLKLIARQIRNSSEPGQTVLDLFGGSGTTLIACEQMDRKCRMMEYDPHYVDVIVDRWEKMTGEKAVMIGSYTGGGGYFNAA